MTTSVEYFDKQIVCYMLDPKAVVQNEWFLKYGSACQLARAIESGQKTISIEMHEMPNFDWWEPRYDNPSRRVHAREREIFGAV